MMTIHPKPETSSPFFGKQLVKFAMTKSRCPEIWRPKIGKIPSFQFGFLAYLLPE
jgi:hypothetical protein